MCLETELEEGNLNWDELGEGCDHRLLFEEDVSDGEWKSDHVIFGCWNETEEGLGVGGKANVGRPNEALFAWFSFDGLEAKPDP